MTAHANSPEQERFWALATPLLQRAGVTRSTMMGFPCLRLDGDFFASCDHRTGELVVKLNEERASALIDAGKAEPFAPSGRRFREWVTVPHRRHRSWQPLLEEALELAAVRRSVTPKSQRKRGPSLSAMFSLRESLRMGEREYERVREIALAFPGVNERLSHGARCFFIQDSRPLCYYHDDHRGDGRISLWCPAPPGVAEELVGAEPDRFFEPTPSASGTFSGWLGVFLDTSGANKVDWDEIAAIIEDAFRQVAPKNLIAQLDHE